MTTARAAQDKPGKGFRWVRWIKSDGRALQIINNVSEEYVDHGRTDFATPEELCQTILWLQKTHSAHASGRSLFSSGNGSTV